MKNFLSSIISIALLANVCIVGAFANEDMRESPSTNFYVETMGEDAVI